MHPCPAVLRGLRLACVHVPFRARATSPRCTPICRIDALHSHRLCRGVVERRQVAASLAETNKVFSEGIQGKPFKAKSMLAMTGVRLPCLSCFHACLSCDRSCLSACIHVSIEAWICAHVMSLGSVYFHSAGCKALLAVGRLLDAHMPVPRVAPHFPARWASM